MPDSFEIFENDLRTALNHFYDPAYAVHVEKLAASFKCATQAKAVQTAVIQAIEILKPGPETPQTARSWRVYLLLLARYVHNLTQKETSDQLGLTIRHLRREQNFAIHLLARAIFERCEAENEQIEKAPLLDGASEDGTEWQSQVRAELDALLQNTPDSASNVDDTLRNVLELILPMTTRRRTSVDVLVMPPDLMVAVPGASLRQILLQALMELNRHIEAGNIQIGAAVSGGLATIEMRGRPVEQTQPVNDHLIREMVIRHEGALELAYGDEGLTFKISLPTERIIVLAVDDNPQLIALYQRYVQGTRFKIASLNQGSRIFETIEALAPDIIVLDAMLPDVDGWELLAHLHAHPDTQSIPIIVCSVVREEELALELGARAYLPKPVRHQQFMQALEEMTSELE